MLKFIYTLLILFSCLSIKAQKVTGKWIVTNIKTDKPKCIVNISTTDDNSLIGKITKLLGKNAKNDARCVKCEGEFKNDLLIGLPILRNFKKEDDKWIDGLITDPGKGKTYESKIWVEEDHPDQLKVRGYVSIFYKTQTWDRVKE